MKRNDNQKIRFVFSNRRFYATPKDPWNTSGAYFVNRLGCQRIKIALIGYILPDVNTLIDYVSHMLHLITLHELSHWADSTSLRSMNKSPNIRAQLNHDRKWDRFLGDVVESLDETDDITEFIASLRF